MGQSGSDRGRERKREGGKKEEHVHTHTCGGTVKVGGMGRGGGMKISRRKRKSTKRMEFLSLFFLRIHDDVCFA